MRRQINIGGGVLLSALPFKGLALLLLPFFLVAAWLLRSLFRAAVRNRAVLLLVAVLGLTACYDPHAHESKIVQLMEAHGSGDISTYTQPGLTTWFAYHRDVATQVFAMCQARYAVVDANWATSAEGSSCSAARVALPPPVVTTDARKW